MPALQRKVLILRRDADSVRVLPRAERGCADCRARCPLAFFGRLFAGGARDLPAAMVTADSRRGEASIPSRLVAWSAWRCYGAPLAAFVAGAAAPLAAPLQGAAQDAAMAVCGALACVAALVAWPRRRALRGGG